MDSLKFANLRVQFTPLSNMAGNLPSNPSNNPGANNNLANPVSVNTQPVTTDTRYSFSITQLITIGSTLIMVIGSVGTLIAFLLRIDGQLPEIKEDVKELSDKVEKINDSLTKSTLLNELHQEKIKRLEDKVYAPSTSSHR